MCGSGTLPMSGLTGYQYTRLYREFFGFMHLKGYEKESWENYYRLANMQAKDKLDFKIIATDIGKKAYGQPKRMPRSPVNHLIEFHQ